MRGKQAGKQTKRFVTPISKLRVLFIQQNSYESTEILDYTGARK